MSGIRIRGPPNGRFDEARASSIARFLLFTFTFQTGMTKNPALHQTPASIEAVQVLQMSDKPLPNDL
jgi:hypothetical protein